MLNFGMFSWEKFTVVHCNICIHKIISFNLIWFKSHGPTPIFCSLSGWAPSHNSVMMANFVGGLLHPCVTLNLRCTKVRPSTQQSTHQSFSPNTKGQIFAKNNAEECYKHKIWMILRSIISVSTPTHHFNLREVNDQIQAKKFAVI